MHEEAVTGQVLIGGPWNLSIYGKGFQHQIFLGNWLFASERVPVFMGAVQLEDRGGSCRL